MDKVTFHFERSTKNTHRFQEQVEADGRPYIGTLYIQKHAFDGPEAPQTIEVTVVDGGSPEGKAKKKK